MNSKTLLTILDVEQDRQTDRRLCLGNNLDFRQNKNDKITISERKEDVNISLRQEKNCISNLYICIYPGIVLLDLEAYL